MTSKNAFIEAGLNPYAALFTVLALEKPAGVLMLI